MEVLTDLTGSEGCYQVNVIVTMGASTYRTDFVEYIEIKLWKVRGPGYDFYLRVEKYPDESKTNEWM